MPMLEYRLVEQSLYAFLKTKLDAAGWGSDGYKNNDVVTLMLSYPQDDDLNKIVVPSDETSGMDHTIVLPVVAVELVDSTSTAFEIGSPSRESRRALISIMGYEEAMTQDIAQTVYEALKFTNHVPLLNYNADFNSPSEVGKIHIENLRLVPVRIVGSPDVADRHRFEIEFVADTYNTEESSVAYPTS